MGVYFFNQATGGSSWAHPVDDIVRGLIAKERAKGTAAHAAAGTGAASAAFCNAHANAAGRGSCTGEGKGNRGRVWEGEGRKGYSSTGNNSDVMNAHG